MDQAGRHQGGEKRRRMYPSFQAPVRSRPTGESSMTWSSRRSPDRFRDRERRIRRRSFHHPAASGQCPVKAAILSKSSKKARLRYW